MNLASERLLAHYFKEHHGETLFIPGACFMTFGSLWTVYLPQNAPRALLKIVIQLFLILSLAAPLLAYVIALLVDISPKPWMICNWMIVVFFYIVTMSRFTLKMRRVPFRTMVQASHPIGDKHTVILWREIVFCSLIVFFTLLFSIRSTFMIITCIYLTVDALVAIAILSYRSRLIIAEHRN